MSDEMPRVLNAKWTDRLLESPRRIAAALAFYTCLPIPGIATLDFQYVARSASLTGLIIGVMLSGLDTVLQTLHTPRFLENVLISLTWVGITGGLHLDGAMDTADGLSVQDPDRRLQVMADSVTGAFGAMAAIAILLIKVAALTDLTQGRIWALILVPAWARWGQQMAIASYPYLKAEGKGAFHKQALPSIHYAWPWALLLAGLGLVMPVTSSMMSILGSFTCGAIALGWGAWFHQKLGGHTGDTYGAVVEWTEALSLGAIAILAAQ